ncbi:TPA: hypothetical protein N0F65_005713 [Lagenidium giganteum]|uniref:Uncharacterized protein n=1 Tax=Lagenidium giganteum TaxID=4803 RepID=A0AAV2Z8S0_9STRA|nr:TPA: hypothetical protein N0F65_005713 [Lagenidium giganteum]
MTKALYVLLTVWGLIVACVQLYAEVSPNSVDCIVAVRPWFRSKPGCALIEISGMRASADTANAITQRLAAFDEDAVSYLILSHHAALYVPPKIQKLRYLVGLKMDNVTLIEWNEDAALTQTHHPRARFVFLVRFNATSIPAGLLSSDFPELLLDVEICVSTLSDVPSNLPSVWSPGAWLLLEHSNFTTVPDVLVDMKLTFLSLSFNEITTVPAGLFTNPWMTMIGLSGNPISQLPEIPVENLTSLVLLSLDSTNLLVLPSWMDDAFFARTVLYLGNSPHCKVFGCNRQYLDSEQDDCRRLHQIDENRESSSTR